MTGVLPSANNVRLLRQLTKMITMRLRQRRVGALNVQCMPAQPAYHILVSNQGTALLEWIVLVSKHECTITRLAGLPTLPATSQINSHAILERWECASLAV